MLGKFIWLNHALLICRDILHRKTLLGQRMRRLQRGWMFNFTHQNPPTPSIPHSRRHAQNSEVVAFGASSRPDQPIIPRP